MIWNWKILPCGKLLSQHSLAAPFAIRKCQRKGTGGSFLRQVCGVCIIHPCTDFSSGELGMPGLPLEHVPCFFQHLGLFLSVCLQQELSHKALLVLGSFSWILCMMFPKISVGIS